MSNILKIENLSFNYGSIQALNEFQIDVPEGSVCAFVGSNGAGKTTTFSIIAGFLRPKTGAINVMGQDLKKFRKEGGMIGLLPQDVSFFEDRTIISQLYFLARLSGYYSKKKAQKEADWAIEISDLKEQRNYYPSMLSRGMKVRLGIAQALLGRPPLVLLDEPAAGLDPLRKKQFYDLILRLKDETTFVISSHQLSELEKICDYVCIIDNGRLLKSSSMSNILSEGKIITYQFEQKFNMYDNIEKEFPEFIFSYSNDKTVMQVKSAKEEYSVAEMNKKLLGWLIKNNAAILEIKQKSSLDQKYFEEIGVLEENG